MPWGVKESTTKPSCERGAALDHCHRTEKQYRLRFYATHLGVLGRKNNAEAPVLPSAPAVQCLSTTHRLRTLRPSGAWTNPWGLVSPAHFPPSDFVLWSL